jgi:hypothetical protein
MWTGDRFILPFQITDDFHGIGKQARPASRKTLCRPPEKLTFESLMAVRLFTENPAWIPPASAVGRKSGRRIAPNLMINS